MLSLLIHIQVEMRRSQMYGRNEKGEESNLNENQEKDGSMENGKERKKFLELRRVVILNKAEV